MTKTSDRLATFLIENGYTSSSNTLELCTNESIFILCEYIWYDKPNDIVRIATRGKHQKEIELDENDLYISSVKISPMKAMEILNNI